MNDVNGQNIENGEAFYLNDSSRRYILLEWDEEDKTFIYRPYGEFTAWSGDYNYYQFRIRKATEFNLKKR